VSFGWELSSFRSSQQDLKHLLVAPPAQSRAAEVSWDEAQRLDDAELERRIWKARTELLLLGFDFLGVVGVPRLIDHKRLDSRDILVGQVFVRRHSHFL
jgi:hypothetical protein